MSEPEVPGRNSGRACPRSRPVQARSSASLALISLPRPLLLDLPLPPWGNPASILRAACAVVSHTWTSGQRSPDVRQSPRWKCSHCGQFQAFQRDFSEGSWEGPCGVGSRKLV